ncbi:hypothetical protein AB0B89_34620 [Sphaerisporangium sp. NPDC049002]|uniref:hypothetical protein n=1 Tax=Sphaerisporangium sp. NPDC049002 TaxID=3155392 RepID=UPI0033D78ACF
MAREWELSHGWHSVTAAYASAASPTPEEAVLRLLDGHPAPGPARAGALARQLIVPGAVAPEAGGSGRTSRPARVVVAPYLLASGHFADKVRRDTLAAGASAVADPLGPAPELATVLLERYAQAVRAFRTGTCAPART